MSADTPPCFAACGVAPIDAAVASFAAADPLLYDARLSAVLADPARGLGNCGEAARQFARHCDALGLDAYSHHDRFCGHPLTAPDMWDRPRPFTPEEWGYDDRPIAGVDDHDVPVVITGGRLYAVDFTAGQYGYARAPLIQRADGWEPGRERYDDYGFEVWPIIWVRLTP